MAKQAPELAGGSAVERPDWVSGRSETIRTVVGPARTNVSTREWPSAIAIASTSCLRAISMDPSVSDSQAARRRPSTVASGPAASEERENTSTNLRARSASPSVSAAAASSNATGGRVRRRVPERTLRLFGGSAEAEQTGLEGDEAIGNNRRRCRPEVASG